MLIRKVSEKDIPAITQLFKETIEAVNSKDYNGEQIKVWSAGHIYTDRWINRLTSQYFIVAVIDEVIVGFGSITPEGYLDMMYVHKNYQGIGIAYALVDELLANASKNNLSIVTSDVSITAKPFFESRGFIVTNVKTQLYNGKEFINYEMQKQIS